MAVDPEQRDQVLQAAAEVFAERSVARAGRRSAGRHGVRRSRRFATGQGGHQPAGRPDAIGRGGNLVGEHQRQCRIGRNGVGSRRRRLGSAGQCTGRQHLSRSRLVERHDNDLRGGGDGRCRHRLGGQPHHLHRHDPG